MLYEVITTVDINMQPQPDGPPRIETIPGTDRSWPADLVLIAIGYSGPEISALTGALGIQTNPNGSIATGNDYMTAVPGIFSAGDAHRGQSLIVWAISEGP